MRERAGEGFIQATDLAETIMSECGLSYRSAHRIVGLAVRRALERDASAHDIPRDLLDEAAREIVGHDLTELQPSSLARLSEPAEIVATRTGVGGAAEAPVAAMLVECRTALDRAERWQIETERQIAEAESRLVDLARRRAQEPAGGQADG